MKNQSDGTQELHPTCFHNLKPTEGNHIIGYLLFFTFQELQQFQIFLNL